MGNERVRTRLTSCVGRAVGAIVGIYEGGIVNGLAVGCDEGLLHAIASLDGHVEQCCSRAV